MRRERIDLCNPNHSRNETRSYRPTRTNQVTPFIGTLHQHLRCQINHSKSIPQNGSQFFFNPQINNIWQRISINLKGFLIGQLSDCFFSLIDKRRVQVTLNDLNRFKYLCQGIGVFNNQFTSQILSQECKFIQHLIGRSKMSLWKWCWLGMFTMTDSSVNHSPLSQTTDDNFTINLFFRFDIVDISRSKNRLAKAVSNLYQTLDNGLEFLHILDLLLGNQGSIDSWWHDLDKVIILGHLNRRIHTLGNDCIKNFAFRAS